MTPLHLGSTSVQQTSAKVFNCSLCLLLLQYCNPVLHPVVPVQREWLTLGYPGLAHSAANLSYDTISYQFLSEKQIYVQAKSWFYIWIVYAKHTKIKDL